MLTSQHQSHALPSPHNKQLCIPQFTDPKGTTKQSLILSVTALTKPSTAGSQVREISIPRLNQHSLTSYYPSPHTPDLPLSFPGQTVWLALLFTPRKVRPAYLASPLRHRYPSQPEIYFEISLSSTWPHTRAIPDEQGSVTETLR